MTGKPQHQCPLLEYQYHGSCGALSNRAMITQMRSCCPGAGERPSTSSRRCCVPSTVVNLADPPTVFAIVLVKMKQRLQKRIRPCELATGRVRIGFTPSSASPLVGGKKVWRCRPRLCSGPAPRMGGILTGPMDWRIHIHTESFPRVTGH